MPDGIVIDMTIDPMLSKVICFRQSILDGKVSLLVAVNLARQLIVWDVGYGITCSLGHGMEGGLLRSPGVRVSPVCIALPHSHQKPTPSRCGLVYVLLPILSCSSANHTF